MYTCALNWAPPFVPLHIITHVYGMKSPDLCMYTFKSPYFKLTWLMYSIICFSSNHVPEHPDPQVLCGTDRDILPHIGPYSGEYLEMSDGLAYIMHL